MKPENIHTGEELIPGADRSGYIPVLDGWRAVAILLVLAYHALVHADMAGHPLLFRIFKIIDHLGPFGVLIFFAISGYLITGRLIARFKKAGKWDLGEFYFKRAFRILPLVYGYLAIVALLGLAHLATLSWGDAGALVFITNYLPQRSWLTGHFWSLSVEEHFYLFWPCSLALLGWKRGFWFGLLVCIAVGIWRPYAVLHGATNFYHTDMRVDYLLFAGMAAIGVACWPSFRKALAGAGSLWGVLLCMAVIGATTLPWRYDARSIQAIALAVLVSSTALNPSRSIRAILGNRLFLFIGQISYSLYVLQQMFFTSSSLAFWNLPWVELLKLPVVFLLAYLSYTYWEKPLIQYARKRIKAKESRQSALQRELVPVAAEQS